MSSLSGGNSIGKFLDSYQVLYAKLQKLARFPFLRSAVETPSYAPLTYLGSPESPLYRKCLELSQIRFQVLIVPKNQDHKEALRICVICFSKRSCIMMESYKQLEFSAREFVVRIRHYVVNRRRNTLTSYRHPWGGYQSELPERCAWYIPPPKCPYPRRGTKIGQCRDAAWKYWLSRCMRAVSPLPIALFWNTTCQVVNFNVAKFVWGTVSYLDKDLQFCYLRWQSNQFNFWGLDAKHKVSLDHRLCRRGSSNFVEAITKPCVVTLVYTPKSVSKAERGTTRVIISSAHVVYKPLHCSPDSLEKRSLYDSAIIAKLVEKCVTSPLTSEDTLLNLIEERSIEPRLHQLYRHIMTQMKRLASLIKDNTSIADNLYR